MAKTRKNPAAHAYLSASGSGKWLNCTPSPRLEKPFGDSSSSYAEEGTLAHKFAEIALRYHLKQVTKSRYEAEMAHLEQDELYTQQMPGEVAKFTDYVLERLQIAGGYSGAKLEIEARLDFSRFVPEGFGTGDAVIISDNTLIIIDLKYGVGVAVSAENNSQLMLYGLGALEHYSLFYDIQNVTVIIVQPRLNSISEFTLSTEELYHWAENTVKPLAQKAILGEGETVAGTHCKFCRAKPTCRAFAEYANAAAALDFAKPETLTEAEIVQAYEAAPLLAEWLKSVSEYMRNEALTGRKWPGYKLIQKPARRKWGDEAAVIKALKEANIAEELYLKLKGIGDVCDTVTKDFYDAQLSTHVVKPTGGLALVLESNKSPAWGAEQAKLDFAEEENEF